MTEKRYTVFISSTFEDLKEERKAVQDVILSGGDFPVQMEYFPATDEDQLDFIKPLIDQCDYYVLIIAGRYGTATNDGTSYTEKEFQHAVSRDIPILVMLNGDPSSIAAGKSETSKTGKAKLSRFIERAQQGRIRKTWANISELKLAVTQALAHAKKAKPSVGWTRADRLASREALEELNELRRENTKIKDAIGHLEVELALPPIPSAEAPVEVELIPIYDSTNLNEYSTPATIQTSWIGAFPVFASNLVWTTYDWAGEDFISVDIENTCDALGAAFAAEHSPLNTQGWYTISKSTYERLSSYYVEVGLMNDRGTHPFTDSGNRIARRQRISEASNVTSILTSGDISIKTTSPLTDEEIPF